jgi:nucleoside 2-deoxyribosyltransferase
MSPSTCTVYLAGELFSAKHLAGNAALAKGIAELSGDRFRCILPQDFDQTGGSARDIRDADLRALLECDAALFHYDGLELDSGTVIEYLFAKFADIPSVLLRTDFRHAGDQKEGDPWNLMSSFYPRTEIVRLDAMEIYHGALRSLNGASEKAAAAMTARIAAEACAALEKVLAMPPVLPRELGEAVYTWLRLMPGSAAPPGADRALELFRAKVEKGLL